MPESNRIPCPYHTGFSDRLLSLRTAAEKTLGRVWCVTDCGFVPSLWSLGTTDPGSMGVRPREPKGISTGAKARSGNPNMVRSMERGDGNVTSGLIPAPSHHTVLSTFRYLDSGDALVVSGPRRALRSYQPLARNPSHLSIPARHALHGGRVFVLPCIHPRL